MKTEDDKTQDGRLETPRTDAGKWNAETNRVFDEINAMTDEDAVTRLLAHCRKRDSEAAALSAEMYVPGLWHCRTCGFVQARSILSAATGEIHANPEIYTEPCPNDGDVMFPMTWKEQCGKADAAFETQLARALKAEEALAKVNLENAALRDWKESAQRVEAEWDVQAVGKLLGVPLGESVREHVQPKVAALAAEVEGLRARLHAFNAMASALRKEIPPEEAGRAFQAWQEHLLTLDDEELRREVGGILVENAAIVLGWEIEMGMATRLASDLGTLRRHVEELTGSPPTTGMLALREWEKLRDRPV